ncbi:MAG: right-handed parallel beta-helix repeat-containing protein, partial [Candidatus Hydrogenedentes bacterium]|nr:right-handed parallel beta-helix repeat-containing protein [Candidatus Hydrogenedentota bacterium]
GRGLRPQLLHCEVSRNIAGGNSGGVGVAGDLIALIQECDIHHNSVLDGDGGGVYSVTLPSGGIRLLHNKIYDNEVYDHGGGVYCGTTGVGESVVSISHNVIWNNTAHAIPHTGETGGGIWILETQGELSENTIVGNRGEGGGEAQGGGIAAYACPNLAIRRNIIALNPVGGGLFGRGAPPTTVVDNIFWSNGNRDVTGTCASIDLTTANLRVDPLLCDPGQGNLAVASNSPALTYPGGVIGAFGVAGCLGVAVERTTWSRIKLGYR